MSGHSLFPVVDAEIALVLERGVEHALARHHLAVADVVRRAVRHDGDLVAVLDEAEGELEAGLAASDDQDLATQITSFHEFRDGGHGLFRAHCGVAAVDGVVGAGDEGRVVAAQE